MRRNRKREPLRVGVIAKTVIACASIAAIGVGYVWQKNQVYRLGDEIKKREQSLLATEKRNTMLAAQLAQFKSPAYLEARCQQYNLGLTAPKETQMVRLVEPGAEWDTRLMPAARTQPAARKPAPRQVASR
jgi:cell division protein FtsB